MCGTVSITQVPPKLYFQIISNQYTLYCTSKLLLALEFKDNVSVTSTYNYVSLNNEIVVLKASSTR